MKMLLNLSRKNYVYVEVSEFSLGTSMRAVCEICKESLELCCDARIDNL